MLCMLLHDMDSDISQINPLLFLDNAPNTHLSVKFWTFPLPPHPEVDIGTNIYPLSWWLVSTSIVVSATFFTLQTLKTH